METINFFLESLRNFKDIGAVTPHSLAAVRKMIEPIDFGKAKTIIELGGGTGAVTKEILKRLASNAKLIVFESNSNFAKVLKSIDDARLVVVEDSAANMTNRLKNMGIQKSDYVISTLPIAIMENGVNEKILEAVKGILAPKGRYVQIQYSLISKKRIKEKFGNIKLDFTLLNLPPAFFYICER